MKNLIFIAIAGLLLSCCTVEPTKPSADAQLQKQTEKSMKEANMQVGYPGIKNFQEKKLMKMIYELRDRSDLICHAYFFNEIKGEYGQYIGKCLGYGIPYSTQFSNPEKMGHLDGGEYGARNPYTLPQPEPNGMFMPEGLSATWLIIWDAEKKDWAPGYFEPTIVVLPFKLQN